MGMRSLLLALGLAVLAQLPSVQGVGLGGSCSGLLSFCDSGLSCSSCPNGDAGCTNKICVYSSCSSATWFSNGQCKSCPSGSTLSGGQCLLNAGQRCALSVASYGSSDDAACLSGKCRRDTVSYYCCKPGVGQCSSCQSGSGTCDECNSGFVLDPATAVCVTGKVPGLACSSNNECQSGACATNCCVAGSPVGTTACTACNSAGTCTADVDQSRYAYTGSLVPDNTIDLCAAMRSALDASTFGHLCELSKDCFSFVCRVSVDVGQLAVSSNALTSTQLSAITSITGPLPTYQFYAAALMNVCVDPPQVKFYAGENTTTWAMERTFQGGSVGVGIPGLGVSVGSFGGIDTTVHVSVTGKSSAVVVEAALDVCAHVDAATVTWKGCVPTTPFVLLSGAFNFQGQCDALVKKKATKIAIIAGVVVAVGAVGGIAAAVVVYKHKRVGKGKSKSKKDKSKGKDKHEGATAPPMGEQVHYPMSTAQNPLPRPISWGVMRPAHTFDPYAPNPTKT